MSTTFLNPQTFTHRYVLAHGGRPARDGAHLRCRASWDASGWVGSRHLRRSMRGHFPNVRACLAAHGLGVEAVVKLAVFVLPGQDFQLLRAVRERHFGAHRPTSTTVYVAVGEPSIPARSRGNCHQGIAIAKTRSDNRRVGHACRCRKAVARERHGLAAAQRAASRRDRRGQGCRRAPRDLHLGLEARSAESRRGCAQPLRHRADARGERSRLDRAAQ